MTGKSQDRASGPPTLTPRKRRVFIACALLLGLGMSLIASESLLWALGKPTRPRPQSTDTPLFEPDPILGWTKRAGHFVLPGYGAGAPEIRRTILPDNRRATAPETDARPGRPIVAIVGCSFTEGWAISDEETFAWKLQRAFPNIEFRNYGTGGYGTYQALLALERIFRGPKSERPAMVIYGWFQHHEDRNVATWDWQVVLHTYHSIGNKHGDTPYCTIDSSGALRKHEPKCPWSYIPLSNHLRTVGYVEQKISYLQMRSRAAQGREVTGRLLVAIRDLCRTHGADFVFTLLEEDFATEAKAHYAAFCSTNGIDFVDCDHPRTPELSVPEEGHPNGALNSLWTADLSRALGARLAALDAASAAGSLSPSRSAGGP